MAQSDSVEGLKRCQTGGVATLPKPASANSCAGFSTRWTPQVELQLVGSGKGSIAIARTMHHHFTLGAKEIMARQDQLNAYIIRLSNTTVLVLIQEREATTCMRTESNRHPDQSFPAEEKYRLPASTAASTASAITPSRNAGLLSTVRNTAKVIDYSIDKASRC